MAYLRLLGGVAIENEAGPLRGPVARRHPLALLAILSTAPSRTLGRSKLVGLLWPESTEKRARHRLNTCLYHVRRALGQGVLVSVGDELRLERTPLESDVWRFRDALAADPPEEAVALYRGPFMDGFHLKGSEPFEKWLDRERHRLRRDYRAALEWLAEEAEERGMPEVAVAWWRERTAEDPYDSRVCGRLMRALVAAGNRMAALRVGREHARLLTSELGAEPGSDVTDLLARLDERPSGVGASGGPDRRPPEASVAILPFRRPGNARDTDTFAQGLEGDLVTELARIPGLTVISRASVLRVWDRDRPVGTIARELGAQVFVEGEVQQVGSRVRLRVQLLDADRDRYVWARRWDRELDAGNLFAIQSDLAAEIVEALRGELGAADVSPRDRVPTVDLEAYRRYVTGRIHLEQRSVSGMERAVELFRSAIDRDDGYAAAHAGLADALGLLASYQHVAHEPALTQAEEAAERALALDPELAEGHIALGTIHMVRGGGPQALRALRRAVRLAPGDARAHSMLAYTLGPLGFWPEGAAHMERASRLDPMSPEIHFGMAARYTVVEGPPEDFLVWARRAHELSPGYAEAYEIEGRILVDTGRPEAGVEAIRKGVELASDQARPRHLSALAHGLVRAGRPEQARQVLAEAADARPFFRGSIRAVLGEPDAAFACFDRAEWTPMHSYQIRYEPALAPLREDERYGALLRTVNRRWGLSADGTLPPADD